MESPMTPQRQRFSLSGSFSPAFSSPPLSASEMRPAALRLAQQSSFAYSPAPNVSRDVPVYGNGPQNTSATSSAIQDALDDERIAQLTREVSQLRVWMGDQKIEDEVDEVCAYVEKLQLEQKKATSSRAVYDLNDRDISRAEDIIATPAADTLVDCFGIQITGRLIRCLSDGVWLNDEVINFYQEMLIERDQRLQEKCREVNRRPTKCHFFNTFFYKKLCTAGYKGVKRWSKKAKVKISELDKVIIPVHVNGNHWCLAVINLRDKLFEYYDSLQGYNGTCLNKLRDYVKEETKHYDGAELNVDDWESVHHERIPRQNNGCDCGVFALMYSNYVSLDKKFDWGQQHMGLIRRRIALDIARMEVDS